MRKTKKSILIGLTMCMLTLLPVINVSAATGYEGYAIYRNGVYVIEWHAGLTDDPYIGYTDVPVVHTPGWAGTKFDTWSNFLNGNTFQGVYKPNGTVTSYNRDLFKSMGRNIAWRHIPYNAVYQIWYDTSSVGTWVDYDVINPI